MIRLMSHKPRINFVPGYNDMSHYFPSEFSVGTYTYMVEEEMYERMLKFTDPNIFKGTREEMEVKIKEALAIGPVYSQLWQFNAVLSYKTNDDGTKETEYIRSVIALGKRWFYTPSWFDINIKLPVLNTVCYLLNKAIYFKVKQELKDWDAILKKIHATWEKKNE